MLRNSKISSLKEYNLHEDGFEYLYFQNNKEVKIFFIMKPYKSEERLDYIRNEMISGVSKYTIIKKLKNSEYDWWPESGDVSMAIIYRTVGEAAETCMFETQAARDEAKALHLERYLDQYRKCNAANDRSNARQILDSIGKLMGLNEKERVEIEHTSYKLKLV